MGRGRGNYFGQKFFIKIGGHIRKGIINNTRKRRLSMEAPKVTYSDAVKREVASIAASDKKGKSRRKIDTYNEYQKLATLLANIQQGKLDKNKIEEDSLYVKGLQIEYEKRYLDNSKKEDKNAGEGNNVPNENPPTNEAASKQTENDKSSSTKSKTTEQKKLPESSETKRADNRNFQPKQSECPTPNKVKPTNVVNKSNGNNNPNNNGVIINGDNNTVIINAAKAAGQKVVRRSNQDDNRAEESAKRKESILKASKENYSTALKDGKQVAKDLIGATNSDEKENVIRLIMGQRKETIMGFIDGFNKNDTVWGIPYGIGGLLDQIDNEGSLFGVSDKKWTPSEKKTVFDKVISTVLQWAKDFGYENDSNYIALSQILNDLNCGDSINTERADKLINELISRGKAEARV